MKQVKNLLAAMLLLMGSVFFLSSCYETHYYHSYNHHSRGWYDHRHRSYPAGVNFEVDVYARHHHRDRDRD